MKIFVTGIGTDVGKTVVSAILCQALQYDYWKPIQCGNLDDSDSLKIKNLLTASRLRIFDESYRFKEPASPHIAAALENKKIALDEILSPPSDNLIIEGAGGVLVPLNDHDLVIDLISYLKSSVVIVSKNYLGSINHTLLTVEALRNRGINIIGVVFNGDPMPKAEETILNIGRLSCLARIRREQIIDAEIINSYGQTISASACLRNLDII